MGDMFGGKVGSERSRLVMESLVWFWRQTIGPKGGMNIARLMCMGMKIARAIIAAL